jgi:hypothetical protein
MTQNPILQIMLENLIMCFTKSKGIKKLELCKEKNLKNETFLIGRSLVNPFMRGVVVGSKAFSNVTRNFSKLNPMNKLKNSSSTTLKSEGNF